MPRGPPLIARDGQLGPWLRASTPDYSPRRHWFYQAAMAADSGHLPREGPPLGAAIDMALPVGSVLCTQAVRV